MARPFRYMWLPSSLLLLAGIAAGGEVRLSGPPRFFAGRTAIRALAGLQEDPVRIRWKLIAFSAEIVNGEAVVSAASPEFRIAVPESERRIPATLSIRGVGQDEIRVDVEIVPTRGEEVRTLLADERVAWVGPAPVEFFGVEVVGLPSPGAIRRFPGRLILLAPGGWKSWLYVPELVDFVRRGGRVLDLGADLAPWVDPRGDRPEGDLARSLPLRPGDGNHLESRGGLVRERFLGSGRFILTRLTLTERRHEDPLAEEVLIELLELALSPLPRLVLPRRVVLGPGDSKLAELFIADEAGTVTILTADLEDARDRAKRSSPALVVGADRTVSIDKDTEEVGPGLSDLPAFLRYLTGLGIRVAADRPWR